MHWLRQEIYLLFIRTILENVQALLLSGIFSKPVNDLKSEFGSFPSDSLDQRSILVSELGENLRTYGAWVEIYWFFIKKVPPIPGKYSALIVVNFPNRRFNVPIDLINMGIWTHYFCWANDIKNVRVEYEITETDVVVVALSYGNCFGQNLD